MIYSRDYKFEDYIIGLKWENLPENVQERAKMCFADLLNALILGSHSAQFEAGLKTAKEMFGKGDIPVIGSQETFTYYGATTAMGHSSNAYDLDDGHKIIRAHPGTAFISGILAAAWEEDSTYKELLEALVAAYETTIRTGAAMIEHYNNYYHSSGSFGPWGIVAGAGKLKGWNREKLNNALAIAEFNSPFAPGGRSVEYPSMNKDGVPYGAMVGALAMASEKAGFVSNCHLMDGEEYKKYADDLGTKYEILDLYFKPYAGCRWGHPAIDAVVFLMREKNITWQDIEKVVIKTFYQATRLSKIVPKTTDEAQYNIAYPTACGIVWGDFGFEQARDENLGDPRVIEMMSRLSFEKDDEIDAMFPGRRCCKAVITLKDGTVLEGGLCEPRGEAYEGFGFEWIEEKFMRMSKAVMTEKALKDIMDMLKGDLNVKVRDIVALVNRKENWTDR